MSFASNGGAPIEQVPEIKLIDTFRALHPHAVEIVRTNSSGRYPSDHFPVTARPALR